MSDHTGARSIVSDNNIAGSNIGTPLTATLDADNNRAFIIDVGGVKKKLIAVELGPGKRAVVSQ